MRCEFYVDNGRSIKRVEEHIQTDRGLLDEYIEDLIVNEIIDGRPDFTRLDAPWG